jgi:hypothetical protein
MSMQLFYNWDPTDPPRYHKDPIDADYFDWLFAMLEGTGLTFLYRCNTAGRAYYPSRLMAPFDHSCVDHNNEQAAFWHRVADMLDGCDPLAEAVRAGRRYNVPVWAWSNWNEFQCVRPGWLYQIDPVWYERPRKYWCSRDGSRFYHGVPAFGDEDVRTRLLGLTREVLDYGVDGLYLSTRSHSWFPCWQTPGWKDHLEPFGFNDCVVDAYRKRYGIDIRYEDYDNDAFLKIKGEQFSTLLSRIGNVVHDRAKQFIIGIVPDRHTLMDIKFAGRDYIQLYKDWERWIADHAIDGLCAEQQCPHQQQLEPAGISAFKDSVPKDFPLHTWADTAWYENRGAGPFSLANWNRNSVDEVLQQIEMARQAGASGIVLHSLYHHTACDTAGESIGGYGVLPRTEYFDALRQRNNV